MAVRGSAFKEGRPRQRAWRRLRLHCSSARRAAEGGGEVGGGGGRGSERRGGVWSGSAGAWRRLRRRLWSARRAAGEGGGGVEGRAYPLLQPQSFTSVGTSHIQGVLLQHTAGTCPSP